MLEEVGTVFLIQFLTNFFSFRIEAFEHVNWIIAIFQLPERFNIPFVILPELL